MKLFSRFKIVIPILLITLALSACRQSEITYRGPNPIVFEEAEILQIEDFVQTVDKDFKIANEKFAVINNPSGLFRHIVPQFNGTTKLLVTVDENVIEIDVNISISKFEDLMKSTDQNIESITSTRTGNTVIFNLENEQILIHHNDRQLGILNENSYSMKNPGEYTFSIKTQSGELLILTKETLDLPQVSEDQNTITSDIYLSSFLLIHNGEPIEFDRPYRIRSIGNHYLEIHYVDYFNNINVVFEEEVTVEPLFRTGILQSVNRPTTLRLSNTPERVTINEREVSLNRNNEILIRRRGINEINIYGVNDYVQTYTISYNNQFYNQVMRLNIYWIPILILGIITIGIKIPKVMKR